MLAVTVAVGLYSVSLPLQEIIHSEPAGVLPRHHAHPGGYGDGGQRRLEDAPSPLLHQLREVGDPPTPRQGLDHVEGSPVEPQHKDSIVDPDFIDTLGIRHAFIEFEH